MRTAGRTRQSQYRPLTAESWQACFWAEDPGQITPSNGASVTSWHNAGSNGSAWTEATNPPTFRSAVTRFGGKPGLEFDGDNDALRVSGSWSNISAPYTVMMVVEPLSETELITGAHGDGDTGALFSITSGAWQGQTNILGTSNSSGVATVGAHIVVFTVNGGSSSLYVNGVQQSFTANIGTAAQTAPVLARHGAILWGNVRFGFAGWIQGTVSESRRKQFERWASNHYKLPLGFYDDFVRDDADEPGRGWTDFHETNPTRQDKSGIRDNAYALVEFQGTVDQQPDSTGWRGGAFRAMPHMTNGFRIVTTGASDTDTRSGSGAFFINPRESLYGAGSWCYTFFGSPLCEIAAIGLNQLDLSYFDYNFFPGTIINPSTVELRIKDGYVESYYNGVRRGVGLIPPELDGSPFHGIQIDTLINNVGKTVDDILIEPWYGTITDYSAPVIESYGAIVTSASATSISVNIPSGVTAGDLLIAIIGVNGGGTINAPSGAWTKQGQAGNVAGNQSAWFTKTADGTETGTLSFGKTGGITSGMAGTMLRISHVCEVENIRVNGSVQANAASTNITAPSVGILGRHRRSIWACFMGASNTVTLPTDFSPVVSTSNGATPQLVVGTRTWDGVIDSPFGTAPVATGTQIGTALSSGQSSAMHFIIMPDPSIT